MSKRAFRASMGVFLISGIWYVYMYSTAHYAYGEPPCKPTPKRRECHWKCSYSLKSSIKNSDFFTALSLPPLDRGFERGRTKGHIISPASITSRFQSMQNGFETKYNFEIRFGFELDVSKIGNTAVPNVKILFFPVHMSPPPKIVINTKTENL